MALQHAYIADLTQVERKQVAVDATLEQLVWENIEDEQAVVDLTRAEYEGLDEEERARFLATTAIVLGFSPAFVRCSSYDIPADRIRVTRND